MLDTHYAPPWLARRAWTRAPGSRHRAAMLGQLLLTDNGGLTWHAVTFCNP
jgi:hypothetical protein